MSMRRSIVQTDKAPKAIGAYSQGVCYQGIFYFSGQIGLCPRDGTLKDGFAAQLQQVLDNIDALLTSQNLARDHVIKTTIFLTDLSNFSHVNAAYKTFFSEPYPARSCVEVSALPKDAFIEVEVIATGPEH